MKKIRLFILLTVICINSNSFAQCFTKLSTNFRSNFAQKSDGTLWNWGGNAFSQFGTNDFNPVYVPTQSAITGSFIFFEAGDYNTFIIKNNGTLWASGDNLYGNLGIGTTAIYSPTFVQIGIASNWKQISAGGGISFGIRTDNTLWGWGQNNGNQMGDNSCCANRLSPGQIGSASDWKQVSTSTSSNAVLALKLNGTMWGWGGNGSALLGPSNLSSRPVPAQLNPSTDWESITTGAAHALALKTNGTLWGWGASNYGQTGDTLPELFFRDTPVQIGTDTWLKVSAGFQCSFGIKSDGTLWAWGRNDYSQLGDGTTIDRRQPYQIGTDNDWIAVSGGLRHAVALKSNGALYTWGDNFYGQLGNGTDTNETSPLYIPVTGCTLDVAGFEKTTMVLNPNPASTQITVNYAGEALVSTLKIYDLTGREVYSGSPLTSASFQATLPIEHLQTGMYVLSLQHNGTTVASQRFVKE